jgi:hypothetical protein
MIMGKDIVMARGVDERVATVESYIKYWVEEAEFLV